MTFVIKKIPRTVILIVERGEDLAVFPCSLFLPTRPHLSYQQAMHSQRSTFSRSIFSDKAASVQEKKYGEESHEGRVS